MDGRAAPGGRDRRRPLARRRPRAGRGGRAEGEQHGDASRQRRPADRRRHRHGRRHLARRRQAGQLGEADRRPVRHPRDHAFPDRRAEDPHRRHGRFRPGRAVICAPELSRAARRAGGRGSDRAVRHRHAPATFPGRCSSRSRRSRSNGRSATSSRGASGANGDAQLRRPDARAAETGRFRDYLRALPVRLGRRPARRPVRHQGLADLALDRLRLRRDRDPARRRGDPARRDRRRAVHRHRRLGQRRVADPLLAALGALDPQRSAASAPPSRSPRTATAS